MCDDFTKEQEDDAIRRMKLSRRDRRLRAQ